jgi:LysR family transcriptional regulator, glycine cleavage system transcriptional activator
MARLPPLEALRIFEVAGRHGSYSSAANELHITHGAVSQRIRQLEDELGLTLFQRQGNRMVLTPHGLRLQAGVGRALSELAATVRGIVSSTAEAELTVSLLPVMAARWLIPRLPRFTARHPQIYVNVNTNRSLANFRSDGVDIAIRFGTGNWKGLRAIKLFDEEVVPVCSPHFNGGRIPRDPVSFLNGPLLIDRNLSWHTWFKSVGVRVDRRIAGNSFVDANLLIEAAVAGQGVALARLSVVQSDLLTGKLIRLSDHRFPLSLSHYAVYPASSHANPAVAAFRDWLLEEAKPLRS